MTSIKLNTLQSECEVDGLLLKIDESIDYKSASDTRVSVGRIVKFQLVNNSSVWMMIADMGSESTTEWISVYVWNEHRQRGLFGSKQFKKVADVTSTQPASSGIEDYPF